jgi:hypothetical protein
MRDRRADSPLPDLALLLARAYLRLTAPPRPAAISPVPEIDSRLEVSGPESPHPVAKEVA